MEAKDTVMRDQEIRDVMANAREDGQEYGDDGEPLPERRVAKDQAEITWSIAEKAGIRKVVEWVNSKGNIVNNCRCVWEEDWQIQVKEWKVE